MGVAVITTSQPSWPWPATLDGKLTAEAIGGGGAGGYCAANPATGGGGKGGSYAKKVITKGAETTLNLSPGTGGIGTTSANGDEDGLASTIVQGVTTVLSAAGGKGVVTDSGTGATTINGSNIGDTTNEGGNGANSSGAGGNSGGGGGAAGPSGVGGNASGTTGGVHGGGNFLNGVDYCGAGADGVAVRNVGLVGNQYGGGGSGGSTNQSADKAGGNGYQGIIVLTWNDPAIGAFAQESGGFRSTSRAPLQQVTHVWGRTSQFGVLSTIQRDLSIPSETVRRRNDSPVLGDVYLPPPYETLPAPPAYDPSASASGDILVSSFRVGERPRLAVITHVHPRTSQFGVPQPELIPLVPMVSHRTPQRAMTIPTGDVLLGLVPPEFVPFDVTLWPGIDAISHSYRTPAYIPFLHSGYTEHFGGFALDIAGEAQVDQLWESRRTLQYPVRPLVGDVILGLVPPEAPPAFDPALFQWSISGDRLRGVIKSIPVTPVQDAWWSPTLPAFDPSLWASIEVRGVRTLPRNMERRDTIHVPGLLPIFDRFLWPAIPIDTVRVGSRSKAWSENQPQVGWVFNSIPLFDPQLWPAIDVRSYRPLLRSQERRDTVHVPGLLPIFDRFLWPAFTELTGSFRPPRRAYAIPLGDVARGILPSLFPLPFDETLWPAILESLNSFRSRDHAPRLIVTETQPVEVGPIADALATLILWYPASEQLAASFRSTRPSFAPFGGFIRVGLEPISDVTYRLFYIQRMT